MPEELITSHGNLSTPAPEIGTALKFGWQAYLKHFIFLLAVGFVAVSLGHLILLWVPEAVRGIFTTVYSSLFFGGMFSIFLALCDGKEPEFGLLFSKIQQFWKFLVGLILFTIAVAIGLVLFIVPGIFLMVKLQFYVLAIAEKDYGPIEALKYSWEITNGAFWRLIGFHFAVAGIMLIPVVIACFLVGAGSAFIAYAMKINFSLAATVMSSILAPALALFGELGWAHCYRQLTNKQGSMAIVPNS